MHDLMAKTSVAAALKSRDAGAVAASLGDERAADIVDLLGVILGILGAIRITVWQLVGIFDYGEHWRLR